MSKAHSPTHRNGRTGDLLKNSEQVCSECFENFATTEAGDLHRVGEFGVNRKCINPESIGLIKILNRYGVEVWNKQMKI